jgi:hypothetical protein
MAGRSRNPRRAAVIILLLAVLLVAYLVLGPNLRLAPEY